MNKRAISLLALLALTTGCQKETLQDFTSTEWKFKARFPTPPRVETKTGTFGAKFTMYGSDARDGSFVVGVAESPIEAGEIDGAVDSVVRNNQATLKSRSSVIVNGRFPGREFIATIPKPKEKVMRGQVCMAGKRLYQLTVIGSEKFVNSELANEFLDSFQVID